MAGKRARQKTPTTDGGPGGGETSAAAQPRPALGRRPWLALLRRARNLRRFAFAMAGMVPGRASSPRRVVRVMVDGWAHQPVLVAGTPPARRRGLRPLALGWGALIAGNAVHGHGMVEPLVVVGIDRTGTVVGVAELLPGHHRRITGASAVLELPGGVTHPPLGGTVAWCGIEP